MSITRESAAQALGMRPSEVVDLAPHSDDLGGHLVTMHDGTRAVVHDDGTVTLDGGRVGEIAPATQQIRPHFLFAEDFEDRFTAAVLDGLAERPHVPLQDGEVILSAAAVAEFAAAHPDLLTLATGGTIPAPPDAGQDTVAVFLDHPAPSLVSVPAAADPADEVPDGSAEAVLAWVAGDVERARRALDAEGERTRGPRATLSKDLAAVIAGATS